VIFPPHILGDISPLLASPHMGHFSTLLWSCLSGTSSSLLGVLLLLHPICLVDVWLHLSVVLSPLGLPSPLGVGGTLMYWQIVKLSPVLA
jgi:hypothetical protein